MVDSVAAVRYNRRPIHVRDRFGTVHDLDGAELRPSGELRIQRVALRTFSGQTVELHRYRRHRRATAHAVHRFG